MHQKKGTTNGCTISYDMMSRHHVSIQLRRQIDNPSKCPPMLIPDNTINPPQIYCDFSQVNMYSTAHILGSYGVLKSTGYVSLAYMNKDHLDDQPMSDWKTSVLIPKATPIATKSYSLFCFDGLLKEDAGHLLLV
ncbi:hypothetical protein TNCV_889471 [Trichonephila clavipes]|nr:hypothetical protein TNCV_889471 [Trichonephila clavipes]